MTAVRKTILATTHYDEFAESTSTYTVYEYNGSYTLARIASEPTTESGTSYTTSIKKYDSLAEIVKLFHNRMNVDFATDEVRKRLENPVYLED